jgi:hypothetical protein
VEEILQQKIAESEALEAAWQRNVKLGESDEELHDINYARRILYRLIEPREVVEVKELQKRYKAAFRLPPGSFWELFASAVADGVLLLRNKVQTSHDRRERVTLVAVNPRLPQIVRLKLEEFSRAQLALTDGSKEGNQ